MIFNVLSGPEVCVLCRLLERLAAEASEWGAVAGGAYRSVPLQVMEDKVRGHTKKRKHVPCNCCLRVPS